MQISLDVLIVYTCKREPTKYLTFNLKFVNYRLLVYKKRMSSDNDSCNQALTRAQIHTTEIQSVDH